MPIHDWSRAPSGLFHHFHQQWSSAICNDLNREQLPDGFYALVEQHAGGVYPDVLTLRERPTGGGLSRPEGGLAVAAAPPKTRFVSRADEAGLYAARANRVAIRNAGGRVVAVIEIVSPGNKNNAHALRSFMEKSLDFLRAGVNLLIIDLFPPSTRDPHGIHPVIWNEVKEEPFELPHDKPLTLAAYTAGETTADAYVEPVAVGDSLPLMPLFLDPDTYIRVPLEPSYLQTWDDCPRQFKEAVLAVTD